MTLPHTAGARLNENQVRNVVTTFAHVDSLLQTVERLASEQPSPFSKERPDIPRDEARLLLSSISLVRARMLAALDRLGIPRPRQTLSARWSVQTSFRFADIALSELTAASLRGYGTVDADAAAELTALAADLRAIVARGGAILHERDAGGLAERLAALPGPAGEVLRAVERMSTEHGLAELRPLIDAAAERAVAATFDVGVFGRVSSGKSSLINALIGSDVLPMGATPVTAVPVRIQRGVPQATVRLLAGGAQTIPVTALAVYATEEANPDNIRGVRAIEVAVPTVADGLRLLDTPGVGSLSASGPAQAFAWLPRCDLGLVLVAAGSPIGREELALVSGLMHTGITCRVLLSKSDLLAQGEVERAVAYVASEVSRALGPAHGVEVRAVSVRPGFSAQLDALREQVLEPLAADHARAAHRTLQARLHRLVSALGAALDGDRAVADDRVVALHRALATAAETIDRDTTRLGGEQEYLLDAVATAVAEAWRAGEDATDVARHAILHAATVALDAVRQAVDGARGHAGQAAESQARRIPPLFDPEFLDALPALPRPAVARHLLGHALAARRLAPLAEPLGAALARYAERLRAWGMGQLDELSDTSWELAPDGAGAKPRAEREELAQLDAMIDEPAPAR